MAVYRLYRLDGVGRIISAEWLEAEDDAAAQRDAASRCESHGTVELWVSSRMLSRIEQPRAD